MICISINQESRRLALVDMLNAGRQCDLLEIRLDRFGKAPDLGEIMQHKPKPVIMTCRRPHDGGAWDGTEDERLALLRQCVIQGADYIEVEVDVADEVRALPPTQRIVSYTNLDETPKDIFEIHKQILSKKPDIVKLTTLARTPEEAWPLAQIVARAKVPTVVVGLGRQGVMLSLLGKKIGAPYTYAALERGMEAYPGQVTISDFREVYRYQDIARNTKLVAITGYGDRETIIASVLNAVFASTGLPHRCLPMGVGELGTFRKLIDAVGCAAVVVSEEFQSSMHEIGVELHGPAKKTEHVDLLMSKNDAWHGFYTAYSTWVDALMGAMRGKDGPENPLQNRLVLIVGVDASARKIARDVIRSGGGVILASNRKQAVQDLAKDVGCRFIGLEAIYTTLHDALVVCDLAEEPTVGKGPPGIHPGYLKPGMTVMDLTAQVQKTPLLREAFARGCKIVTPRQLILTQLVSLVKQLTSRDVSPQVLAKALPSQYEED